jgi:hypothetical protein
VLAQQDSIGLVTWNELASRAGISDTIRFDVCRSGSRSVAVDSGLEWGRAIGVSATPSIAINGVLFPRAPRLEELRELVASAIRNEDLMGKWKR